MTAESHLALDLNLHVATRVPGGFERGSAVGEGERGGEERRGVDAAVRHEADRARPQTGGADDAAHLERLGLNEPDLDLRATADVDADDHDASAERGDREGARHRGGSAGRLEDDVEAAATGRLVHLPGERARSRVDRGACADLETELPAVLLG